MWKPDKVDYQGIPRTVDNKYWVSPVALANYPDVLKRAREKAYEHGYAITEHGTAMRDLDLVAVPWTDKAISQEQIATEIAYAIGGYFIDNMPGHTEPTFVIDNPHGRKSWLIRVAKGGIVDLSVMPPLSKTNSGV